MAKSEAVKYFLARIEPQLAETFSVAQLDAIELHFAMRYIVKHAIDWRAHIWLPFSKIYFVVLAGRTKRARDR